MGAGRFIVVVVNEEVANIQAILLQGELLWVDREEALKLPMQDWFKRRFPLFFEEGTFELSEVWDEETGRILDETIKHYPAGLSQGASWAD